MISSLTHGVVDEISLNQITATESIIDQQTYCLRTHHSFPYQHEEH